jgi:hypothetical protein
VANFSSFTHSTTSLLPLSPLYLSSSLFTISDFFSCIGSFPINAMCLVAVNPLFALVKIASLTAFSASIKFKAAK